MDELDPLRLAHAVAGDPTRWQWEGGGGGAAAGRRERRIHERQRGGVDRCIAGQRRDRVAGHLAGHDRRRVVHEGGVAERGRVHELREAAVAGVLCRRARRLLDGREFVHRLHEVRGVAGELLSVGEVREIVAVNAVAAIVDDRKARDRYAGVHAEVRDRGVSLQRQHVPRGLHVGGVHTVVQLLIQRADDALDAGGASNTPARHLGC